MADKRKQGGLEGLFGGFTDLVEKLAELAEKGEKLSRTQEFEWQKDGSNFKGICGFSIRTALGGDELKVEPFGNIRRDEQSGETVVQEVREPVADVFEEEDHTLVVAEMPGIGADDIQLEVHDDVLTIQAERGDKKYRKEVLLPRSYSRDKMTVTCNNGVLEISCW